MTPEPPAGFDDLFKVALAPWLVAAGDGTRLFVYRSIGLGTDDEPYRPVADYIRERGMVLVSTETGPYEGMHGRTEQSHYATPEARALWYQTHTEENR